MAYDSINSKTAIAIIKEIKKWRNLHSLILANNERWYIGITDNPERRQKQHERKAINEGFHTNNFVVWDAKTKSIARSVESYWHKKGMLETDLEGNTNDESKYIYVYKKYPIFKPKR